MHKRSSKWAIIAVLLVAGCAKTYTVHPGSANKFDSQAYDALLVTDAVIKTTKTDLANNVFPASIAAKVKDTLNYLITSYNVADTTYLAYHSAALAGTATSAQEAAVSQQLANVSSATQALTSAKAGQ